MPAPGWANSAVANACTDPTSRLIAEVHYHCAPGQARQAVERAVYAVRAERFISIGEAVAR